MKTRYQKHSTLKALTSIAAGVLALGFLAWWLWEPIITILYLIGFALA